jgi:hypothetical protein
MPGCVCSKCCVLKGVLQEYIAPNQLHLKERRGKERKGKERKGKERRAEDRRDDLRSGQSE